MECYVCKKDNPPSFLFEEYMCCELCKEKPELLIRFFDEKIGIEKIILKNGNYATFQLDKYSNEGGCHYTEYYNKEGGTMILLTYNYNKDKIPKSIIKYYMDGHIKESIIYKNGTIRQYRKYYDDGYGTPYLKIEYEDSKYHGEYIIWNTKHQILKFYNYKHGKYHGECYDTDINGQIKTIKEYDDGNIISEINYC